MNYDFQKPSLILILAIALLIFTTSVCRSESQAELFDLGYEYYLSSQHEKALETFKTYLQGDSKAPSRDAAMFWLAKSLRQLGRTDDAARVVAELRRLFPQSIYVLFADRDAKASKQVSVKAAIKETGAPTAEKEAGTEKFTDSEKARLETLLAKTAKDNESLSKENASLKGRIEKYEASAIAGGDRGTAPEKKTVTQKESKHLNTFAVASQVHHKTGRFEIADYWQPEGCPPSSGPDQ